MFKSFLMAILFFGSFSNQAKEHYYPVKNNAEWQQKTPEQAGFSVVKLDQAIEFAQAQESDRPRDQALSSALGFAREPYNQIIGPTTVRGAQTGIILRHGYIVAIWGLPNKIDMTHSISKSFLSTVAALAYDQQLIRDLNEPIANYINSEHFASEHNRTITWEHMLRQTSAWEGTLWDKPDWGDRPVGDDPFAWPNRETPAAGTEWKYNDVRVNAFALALLELWRRPLPQVLKQHVMDPIGASDTWRWHGYENSWVMIDGLKVQSVSGGGHWGGGMFINAYDQARFGLLTLRKGQWQDQQVFSEQWYDLATTPTKQNPSYGYMNWFLNADKKFLPNASASSITHLGAGTNMVHVDPEHDLVVVARWIKRDAMDSFIQQVLAAIEP